MTVIFEGGSVFTHNGEIKKNITIVTNNGLISKMLPTDDAKNLEGQRVDTSGCTLLPGLIDCHVHLTFDASPNPRLSMQDKSHAQVTIEALINARTTLRSGITAVRDCGGKNYIEFAVRDAIKRGHFPGPTILAAGQAVCMTGGHGEWFGCVADGPAEILKAVRQQLKAGSDFLKIMATGGVTTECGDPEDAHYTEEELRVGINEAKRFRKRSASHAQGSTGVLNAVRAGITSIEHGFYLDNACIDEMLKNGTYLVPTLYAVGKILNGKSNGVPERMIEKTAQHAEQHINSIQAFYKAGGKIAMGTDSGVPLTPHGDNCKELLAMVEIGMSPKDVLLISTKNAADLMGLEHLGRIQEGCAADFLLVNGNPLEDIRMAADKANHKMVFKNGELVH